MGRPDDNLLIVEGDGALRHLVLNRPDTLNALNAAVLAALDTEIRRLADDPSIRAVILSGSGERAFCAGADLDDLAELDAATAHTVLARGQAVMRGLERCGVPTIAAVDGYALGGGFELALACTLVVASERAQFGLPEAGLGLIPGYGGTQRLSRAIGLRAARRLMITGDRLSAAEADRLGLLAAPPVPAGDAVAAAADLARRIGTRSASAVRTILGLTDPGGEKGLARETAMAALATASPDAREGIQAFREKRTPAFVSSDPSGGGV